MTAKQFGVLAHPGRPQSAPVARRIAQTLRDRGCDAWVLETWTPEQARKRIAQAQLVVAIGGDGAMLRAAHVCAGFGVPVLGVNMGYLGFLTEISSPENWDSHIDQVLAGDYWIETRMMLKARVTREERVIAESEALNDVVISRGAMPRMVRLDAFIDGDWTTTYSADALIIATATGSTAYALAGGGPILPPELRSILIVPVAPHLSLDRPIVLPEGARVDIVVSPDTQAETVLSADGTPGVSLIPGDHVTIQASEVVSRFARLRERNYFYRSLLDRMEPRKTASGTPTQLKL
ncbi:MAG: NAD(+)/NADH kinase [Anaerolineae bacterium]|nr:NAD(+)/NADH kinase [Anaerolineae bacterium]